MSEFVAGAFVDVRPDTKGFREQLKKKVNNEIKQAGVFKVPIAFEIKAFKKQLQQAAREAKPTHSDRDRWERRHPAQGPQQEDRERDRGHRGQGPRGIPGSGGRVAWRGWRNWW